MQHTVVGVDTAKRMMQVHWGDAGSGGIVNKPVNRALFLEFFVNRAACPVGVESFGGSQHWARRLIEIEHQVDLMPAKFIKAFMPGKKDRFGGRTGDLDGHMDAKQGSGGEDRTVSPTRCSNATPSAFRRRGCVASGCAMTSRP